MSNKQDLTCLLGRWAAGDRGAVDRIFDALYDDLRRLAHRVFQGERSSHTLEATALLHETYLEISELNGARFGSRLDFLSLVACLMRRALVDHGRRRGAQKRGGSATHVSIREALSQDSPTPEAILELDRALKDLATHHPRLAQIVELRYFVGLTVEEIAGLSGASARTVARHWQEARAKLYRSLSPADAEAA